MPLTYVEDVGSLFRAYADEPDGSFMPDAQVSIFLENAYEEFRRFITRLQPGTFSTRVTLSITDSEYDLADTANAVVLFGPDANLTETDAGANKLRLLSIVRLMPATDTTYVLEPAASLEELAASINGVWGEGLSAGGPIYYLDGTVLRIAGINLGSVVLDYVPMSTVDWTKLTDKDEEWIDNFIPYHDIIAMLAYKHYAIKDMESNQQLNAALQLRMSDLEQFIIQRNNFQSSYIK